MHGEIVVLAGDYETSVGGAGDWPGRDGGAVAARGRDHRAHHPGSEQPGDRRPRVPQHQLGEDLHPLGLPQDRRLQPHPSGHLGSRARLQARHPAHHRPCPPGAPGARHSLLGAYASSRTTRCSSQLVSPVRASVGRFPTGIRPRGAGEARLDTPGHRLAASRRINLPVRRPDVGLDRVDAQVELIRDVLIAEAASDKDEHGRLARAQSDLLAEEVGSFPLLRDVAVLESAGDGLPDDLDEVSVGDVEGDAPLHPVSPRLRSELGAQGAVDGNDDGGRVLDPDVELGGVTVAHADDVEQDHVWVGDGRSGGGQREGGRDAREHGTEAELDDALSRDDLYPDHVLIRLHTLSVEDPGDDALHPWLPQT